MKKFLSSVFPYLLIAAFFVGVIAYSAKTAADPLYSYEFTEPLPESGIITEASGGDTNVQAASSSAEESEIETETETETETASPESEKTGTICYYTPSGAKYHLDKNCRYLKNRETVLETDTETAVNRGLTPCSVCGIQ